VRRSRQRLVIAGSAATVAIVATLVAPVPGFAATRSTGAAPRAVAGRPDWAIRTNLVRRAAAGEHVDLAVVLGFRDPAGVAALSAAVSDPRSPEYGRYLTPAQFIARFSQPAATVAKVAAWLRSQGLSVGQVPANRLYVPASGTVALVERAFGTRLNYYRRGSAVVRGPASSPKVPAALAPDVRGVMGLARTTERPLGVPSAPPPRAFVVGRPCSAFWGQKVATNKPEAYGHHVPWAVCGYGPAQLQGAYGVDRLVRSGIDGSGQTVAVIDAYHAITETQDLKIYSHLHGLPVPHFTQRNVPPAPGSQGQKRGWYGEEALDLDAVHSMAPGADLVFEGAKDAQTLSLLNRMEDVVDHHVATIVSNSYGGVGEGDPDRAAEEAVFQQAAVEGIGVYFSSGDCGDELDPQGLCGGLGKRRADYPPSSPNVTAVGGTSLGIGASNQYLFETGWGTGYSHLSHGTAWKPAPPGDYFYGSGGGTSTVFAEPSYQKGVVPDSLSDYWGHGTENRVVPDISADADPSTGLLVGETQTFPHHVVKYAEYRIGGTSVSCPLVAGMMADVQQAVGHDLGFVNPLLYSVAGSDGYHDIVDPAHTMATARADWNNEVDASDGRSISLRTMNFTGTLHTTPGYDDVTGLGTPNMPNLVARLTS